VGIGVIAAACVALGIGLLVGAVRDRRKIAAGELTLDTGKPLWQRVSVVVVGALMCGGFLLYIFSI